MSDEIKTQRLGDYLIKKGWIDSDKLADALKKQKISGEFLGDVLLKEKYITEEQFCTALSEQYKVPFVRISNMYIDWNFVMKFSSSLILQHQCFPIKKTVTDVVFALTNILDGWAMTLIEQEAKGFQVKIILVTKSDMKDLLERYRQYTNIQIRRKLEGQS